MTCYLCDATHDLHMTIGNPPLCPRCRGEQVPTPPSPQPQYQAAAQLRATGAMVAQAAGVYQNTWYTNNTNADWFVLPYFTASD